MWERLLDVERKCRFEKITAEELIIAKFRSLIKEKDLKEKLEKATQKIPDFVKILQEDTQERQYEQKKESKRKSEPMNKILGKQFKKPDCRFCGNKNWTPEHKCPAKAVICRNCGKKGHFKKVCKSKPYNL